jgi:hypothetical protein
MNTARWPEPVEENSGAGSFPRAGMRVLYTIVL